MVVSTKVYPLDDVNRYLGLLIVIWLIQFTLNLQKFFPKDPTDNGSGNSDVSMCWALHREHQDDHSRGKVSPSLFPSNSNFATFCLFLSVGLQKLKGQGF